MVIFSAHDDSLESLMLVEGSKQEWTGVHRRDGRHFEALEE